MDTDEKPDVLSNSVFNLPALHVVNNLLPWTNDLALGSLSRFMPKPNCCYVGIGTRAYTATFDGLWPSGIACIYRTNTENTIGNVMEAI